MTQYLPPNLLALFAAREPIPFLPPAQRLPHEKKTRGYSGVGYYLHHFENPKDTPLPLRFETREERIERKRRERAEQAAYKLEQGIALWDPQSASNATMDPYKSLFVARINFDSSETKLRREFEVYGPIKKIVLVHDKVSGKPRGYAFIEFEHERDMHSAYKHGDGKKIDGRRVLVDVERGRTVKGWLPRRLGGGLGGTRKGAPDENVKHSGRDDARTEESREPRGDRYENKERRERDRDRSEKRRSRSRDRERDRGDKEKRRRSKSPKDRDRSDRERRSRYDNNSVSSNRRSKSGRESNYNNEDQAGGDGVVEKRKSRSRERESRKRHTRDDGKSRSISRERKRSHRDPYDNNGRIDKMDIKNEIMIKEEPEDTLYDNTGSYENEQFNNPYGENSNSSSYDQYQAQNYSQPTYVAYNTKDDTP